MSSPTAPGSQDGSLLSALHLSMLRPGLGCRESAGAGADSGGEGGFPPAQQRGLVGALRGKPHRELSPSEQQELRRKINNRERKRMQDLNIAMDALREVMVPYSSPGHAPGHAPSHAPGRRLSKISTLILARNYILLLGSSLQEMRRLLGGVSVGVGVPLGLNPAPPRLLLAGGWPFFSPPGQLLLTSDSILTNAKCPLLPLPPEEHPLPLQWGTGAAPGGQICTCGVCRLPRFPHSSPVPRFPK